MLVAALAGERLIIIWRAYLFIATFALLRARARAETRDSRCSGIVQSSACTQHGASMAQPCAPALTRAARTMILPHARANVLCEFFPFSPDRGKPMLTQRASSCLHSAHHLVCTFEIRPILSSDRNGWIYLLGSLSTSMRSMASIDRRTREHRGRSERQLHSTTQPAMWWLSVRWQSICLPEPFAVPLQYIAIDARQLQANDADADEFHVERGRCRWE